jgi:hypothetical protein
MPTTERGGVESLKGSRDGDPVELAKLSSHLPLMKAIQLIPFLAKSISMDSTYNKLLFAQYTL